MPTPKLTAEIIAAALDGYEVQKRRIDDQIAALRAMLSGGPAETATTPEAPTHKRKKFSAAARRHMKEAQQRRWAKIRGESEPPAPATPEPKRRLSKAGRAAIVAATKKRWTAFHKSQKSKETLPKKKLSPARKAALVANLAKARAARAAKRAEAAKAEQAANKKAAAQKTATKKTAVKAPPAKAAKKVAPVKKAVTKNAAASAPATTQPSA